ncbi:uncharacterized protein [Clytia hemisphaerica]|uniref:Uncharacterized protein n=1 Tax=Clytia hemisphaerica TaxID=252671 RepID=A0A7M5X295_9CNID|eukprot:TCONS_00006408-protein
MDVASPTHALRPCQLMLRCLALWQPSNAKPLVKHLNKFGFVMLLALVGGIIYIFYGGSSKWEGSVNGILFSAIFTVAFLCTKWHYRKGNYSWLVENELQSERNYSELVRRYNILAFVLWAVCSGQLVSFFYSTFKIEYHWKWIIYVYIAVIGNGWRICWLILYAYICHVHWRLIQSIREKFRRYRNEPIEAEQIEDLMQRFNVLKKKLNKSERALHGIISLSVAIHVVDMTAYSFAFFFEAYKNALLVVYLLEMVFISLFIKLIPAAIVNSSLRKLMILVGDMCSPLRGEIQDQMMLYHQHIHITEQDIWVIEYWVSKSPLG